jgi:putative copper resistance protein D
VIATSIIVLRFLQYSGAMILLGSSLFFMYALPKHGLCAAQSFWWPKRLLIFSSAILLLGAASGLVAQTGFLAGSLLEGFRISNLQAVITQMDFGLSSIARGCVAAILLLCLNFISPSRIVWTACAIGGAIICASFVWMGHGAATEGLEGIAHILADITHLLAASVWIGALVCFVFLLMPGQSASDIDEVLFESLRRFSGIGFGTVVLIVLSGLINSWFMIGPHKLTDFWLTLYGQILVAKVVLFGGMLGFAASNRFRLTPALGRALGPSMSSRPLSSLRRSIILETAVAFAVLGLVSYLGTLPPPMAV